MMHKFPSIEQFSNCIRTVKERVRWQGKDADGNPIYDDTVTLPKIRFRGTVKIHGTNAAIHFNRAIGEINYQSRERVLTLEQDNCGFMLHMKQHEELLWEMTEYLWDDGFIDELVVYGEWCGKGIQKGVAVNELDKMFVAFAIYQVGSGWVKMSSEEARDFRFEEARIFNIMDFPTWEITVDFAQPELVQNKLIAITEEVERQCPVGKFFGVEGIGEGVVWTPIKNHTGAPPFKVKGEKHSVSKVKSLAPVDLEAIQNAQKFVEEVVTEARLEQGLWWLEHEALKPIAPTSTGDFIRWVYNDIMKEEETRIVEAQIDPKKIGALVANAARPWFLKRL
jgi:hypothetical protein